MPFVYFMGVDVSEKTLDFALVMSGQRFHMQIENNVAGIRQALKMLKAQLYQSCKATLQALEKDIAQTQKQIRQLIEEDQQYYALLTSVDGIGEVTATQVIIATNEFEDFTQAKAFACHAGVAPFAYQSGSSVRGKTKVNPKADKKLKRLLHLAALTAIRIKGELQDYYHRKVKEGKHKMSVINAVRNKLILRMFAAIHKNKKYEKIYPIPLKVS